MMRRRPFVALVCLLGVGAAIVLVLWRPWQQRPAPVPAAGPDPPADIVSVTIRKRSGGPCGVTIMGAAGGATNSSSASLAVGDTQSGPLQFPAPYTIQTVTVERAGNLQRRELNITLSGGQRYELLVGPDDTVSVASP